MIYDIIIVGSGVTGVAAAMGFEENGIVPAILDVGHLPQNDTSLSQNFYDYRKYHDSFNIMIGESYEGISNLLNRKTLPPKLTSPYMRFVTKDAEKLPPIYENGFTVI